MPLEQVSEIRYRLVTAKSGKTRRRQFVSCRCSYCGGVSEKQARNAHRDKSCGCQKNKHKIKHGMRNTQTYRSWASMRTRTTNLNCTDFKYYGGRGIKVCDRWLNSFETFLEDMGECPTGHSLDRIDNSRGYEPGNCRWADAKLQGRNRRSSRILTINGVSCCLSEWAENPEAANYNTILKRLARGWTDREAVFGKNKRNGETKDASQS